jgi:glycosyltransferase involved in cell wall biosynthesis
MAKENIRESICFVIPVLNAASTLESCLKSIFAQKSVSDYEVRVVDNGSTDSSREICLKYPVILLDENQQGASFARNKGWRSTEKEYIAFIDADVVLADNWADEVIGSFDNVVIGASQGKIIPAGDENIFLNQFRFWLKRNTTRETFLATSLNGNIVPLVNTAACIIKREALLEQGGFLEELRKCEDTELSMRFFKAGWAIKSISNTEAKVYYDCGIWDYLVRSFSIGYWTVRYQSLYGKNLSPSIWGWNSQANIKLNIFNLLNNLFRYLGWVKGSLLSLFTSKNLIKITPHKCKLNQHFEFTSVGIIFHPKRNTLVHHVSKIVITDSEDKISKCFDGFINQESKELMLFLYEKKFLKKI